MNLDDLVTYIPSQMTQKSVGLDFTRDDLCKEVPKAKAPSTLGEINLKKKEKVVLF